MAFLDTLIIALITGGVSSLGTIAALKTDINWIKRVQQWRYRMKGHKCKGRRSNGQLKKGYTLNNGRVVRANITRKRDKKRQ